MEESRNQNGVWMFVIYEIHECQPKQMVYWYQNEQINLLHIIIEVSRLRNSNWQFNIKNKFRIF